MTNCTDVKNPEKQPFFDKKVRAFTDPRQKGSG